jgi:hypothetical protein
MLVSFGCTKKAPEAEKTNVEATVKGFYSALEKLDYDAMRSYLTPEFTFFEDGTEYPNIDEFISFLKKNMDGGSAQINMVIVRTEVSREMANSIIKFDGHFKGPQVQFDVKSYENYVLKKINGKWLIDFFQSYHFPIENNKNYSSVHLINIPSDQTISSLNDAITAINQVIAKIGYPNCGYSVMNVIAEKDVKYNYVLSGKWVNEEIYNTIHNNPEYKKAIEDNRQTLVSFLSNQVYLKYIMP